jgi:A/G-specific adenine glycosylase
VLAAMSRTVSRGRPPARYPRRQRGTSSSLGLSMSTLHRPILRWYATHARDLPWRRPDASAWSVLVSELMLQQTPVARVLPVHEAWLQRWPTPAALAAEPSGEAVRAWGRLGYPRRALRLHASAVAIVDRYDGRVPESYDALVTLPGVGDYTAAAVASFAFGKRHVVLDTNVRRVLARAVAGVEFPASSVTWPRRCCPTTRGRPPPGRSPRWSSGRWSVPPLGRPATAARCPTSAAGSVRAHRRTPGRRAAARPGPGPTGSAEAGCWRCCGTASVRCTAASWRGPGGTRSSASGALTRWSVTVWPSVSIPSPSGSQVVDHALG